MAGCQRASTKQQQTQNGYDKKGMQGDGSPRGWKENKVKKGIAGRKDKHVQGHRVDRLDSFKKPTLEFGLSGS